MTDLSINEHLRQELKVLGPNWENVSLEAFTRWAKDRDVKILEELLVKTRSTRDFYKKILDEEYYKKHPSDQRFEHSAERVKFFNARGRALKELIDLNNN